MDQEKMQSALQEAFQVGMIQIPPEIAYLGSVVAQRQPKIVVEIGSCFGGSLLLWHRICQPEILISIDMESPNFGSKNADYQKRKQIFDAIGAISIIGDSHFPDVVEKLKKSLQNRKIDMLVIDGDHTFEGVTQDFLMYRDLVADDGFIAFHDIVGSETHRRAGCYVSNLWDSLRGYLKISVNAGEEWGGWGLLFKNFVHK